MSWEDELARLRDDLGPTRRMRIRWRYRTIHEPSETGWEMLTKLGDNDEVLAALYEPTAQPGARPLVEVELRPDPAIESVEQGSLVDVAGKPAAGHAVVLVLGTSILWPTYPATLRLRSQRL